MEEEQIRQLEAKINALEELLTVSETSFLEEAEKLESTNEKLQDSIEKHEKLESDIKQILDAPSDAIRVIDKDYNIIYASKSLSLLKGINTEDIIGKKCHEVDPAKECFTEECSLKRVLRTGEKFEKELYLKSVDGVEIPYRVSVVPYTNSDGDLIGMVKSYKDITEEKQARKIAEENAQQQGRIEMGNNMLHDIGNALTGISAYALKPQLEKDWTEIKSLQKLKDLFIAKEKDLIDIWGNEKGKALISLIDALIASIQQRKTSDIDFFQKISKAVGHISSVLDLQRRYMREKSTPIARNINVMALIEDSLAMLSSSLEKRNIQVKINSGGEIPYASGDQTRLVRVFLNIIKNIYEAFDGLEMTEDRALEINIDSDEETEEVKVVFIDNASGFSPEVAEKLFERGFTTKERGFGIGLHECRSVIESHSGTISIESKVEGIGSATTVKLPLINIKKG